MSDDVGGAIWRVVAPGAKPSVAIAAVKSTSVGDRVELPDSLKGEIAAPTGQFKN